MDVDFSRVVDFEEPSKGAVEVVSVDNCGVDHHCVVVECAYGKLSNGELCGQVHGVVRSAAGMFMQEDRAARPVGTVDDERVVSDQKKGLAYGGIAKTLATRVSGVGIGDETHPAAGSEVIGCNGADGVEAVGGAHIDEGMDATIQSLAEIRPRSRDVLLPPLTSGCGPIA